jgi:hypothetical protein
MGINFTDFLNTSGVFTTSDHFRSEVFSVSGDYNTFQPFNLAIDELRFQLSSTLSIADIDQLEQTKVSNYPNPFASNTTFQLVNESEKVTIVPYDLSGRSVAIQNLVTDQRNRTVNYS